MKEDDYINISSIIFKYPLHSDNYLELWNESILFWDT